MAGRVLGCPAFAASCLTDRDELVELLDVLLQHPDRVGAHVHSLLVHLKEAALKVPKAAQSAGPAGSATELGYLLAFPFDIVGRLAGKGDAALREALAGEETPQKREARSAVRDLIATVHVMPLEGRGQYRLEI